MRIKMKIENVSYYIHPVYDLYAADRNGNIINIVKKALIKGYKNNFGYMKCTVRKHGQRGQNSYFIHRFVWECFNGIIPEGKVIDHINDIKDDNRLCNLQLMTQQQNCKKSAKDRDYSFVSENHKNQKCVKAINVETKEITYYNSLYATQQHLGVNAGIVSMCCQGINNAKSGISKKDNQQYKFEYVKKEEMPDDYFKSANIRPKRVSDEDKKKHQKEAVKKWQNKEYDCPKCGKIYKNNYRYVHNKICK